MRLEFLSVQRAGKLLLTSFLFAVLGKAVSSSVPVEIYVCRELVHMCCGLPLNREEVSG